MIARTARHFRHWLVPHHSNNFRARLLHNSGLFGLIGIVVTFNIFLRLLESTPLHILGFDSSIMIDEVVRLTNQERMAAGLATLNYNEKLSDAARRKAANMFEENYWAHNSPSGKTPWVWINAAGYRYLQAGENLAKDFGSSDRLMSAWMASPTHKANIVSNKFQDIGIAVVPGSLQGQDTVLVVQMFGSTGATAGTVPQVAQVQASSTESPATPTPKPTAAAAKPSPVQTPLATPEPTSAPTAAAVMELKEFAPLTLASAPAGLVDTFGLKKTASLATTGLLIVVLLGDVVIAESRRLSRRVGKNWAHILYINVILILVTIINSGNIL